MRDDAFSQLAEIYIRIWGQVQHSWELLDFSELKIKNPIGMEKPAQGMLNFLIDLVSGDKRVKHGDVGRHTHPDRRIIQCPEDTHQRFRRGHQDHQRALLGSWLHTQRRIKDQAKRATVATPITGQKTAGGRKATTSPAILPSPIPSMILAIL